MHVRAWQAAYRGQVPDAYLDQMDEEQAGRRWTETLTRGLGAGEAIGRDGTCTTLLLEDGDLVVGIASVGRARGEYPVGTGELWMINLVPEAWGSGLGRQLLAASVDELRWQGFSEAVLWVLDTNRRARRFYQRQGWVPDGTVKEDASRGFTLTEVRYRRQLVTGPGDLRIAPATVQDVPHLLRLYDQCARWLLNRGISQWRPGDLPPSWATDFVSQGETMLVMAGDELAASVTVTWDDPLAWPDAPAGGAGYVHKLMVDRRWAGQGLGRRLLQRAERAIAAAGRPAARLDCVALNPTLRRYYERAGYRYVGDTDFGGRLDLNPSVLYEKALPVPATTAPPGPTA